MTYRVGYFLQANPGVYEIVRRALPAGFELVTLSGGSEAEAIAAARDLDFLISGKASAALIAAAPKLRLIQLPGVGYDKIDLTAAAGAKVPVAVCLQGSSECVAEFTLLLMLAVSRRIVELHNSLREGKWLMWDRRLQSHNLHRRTLGLVGLGRIGRCVAERARAFGMKVQYYDVVRSDEYPLVSFDELLATSDIVSLHVPLTPETNRLMGARQLAAMKPGAILINAARGELVDEAALLAALNSGHLGGAGLDVFEKEPVPANHPLLALPQVVAAPHVANGTVEALEEKAQLYASNMQRVLAGRPPEGLVPAPR